MSVQYGLFAYVLSLLSMILGTLPLFFAQEGKLLLFAVMNSFVAN